MLTRCDNTLLDLVAGVTQPEIKAMLTDLSKAPDLYQPSEFWLEYLTLNLKQLSGSGLDNFKQTVNHNYFNWTKKNAADQCAKIAPSLSLASKLNAHLSLFSNLFSNATAANTSVSSWIDYVQQRQPMQWCLETQQWSMSDWLNYVKFVCYLWEFTHDRDDLQILDKIEEPKLGNPLAVHHRNLLISQDICNSVMEVNAAATAYGSKIPSNLRVGELGAGYGRNAYVLLKSFKDIRIAIIDIPPALYLCQWYLSKLFPERKIFQYRQFSDFEQVRDEFESSSIAFLLPHQVESLPDKTFDLFLNISSLHEMKPTQIDMWFGHINRLCSNGYFYSKQWITSNNPFDSVVIRREEYPVKKNWTEVFNRECPVQTLFFEVLYSVQDNTQ